MDYPVDPVAANALQNLTTMGPRSKQRRWDRAFSLNDAARIHRMIKNPSEEMECPRCGGTMARVVGGDVWLIACELCALNLVVRDIPH